MGELPLYWSKERTVHGGDGIVYCSHNTTAEISKLRERGEGQRFHKNRKAMVEFGDNLLMISHAFNACIQRVMGFGLHMTRHPEVKWVNLRTIMCYTCFPRQALQMVFKCRFSAGLPTCGDDLPLKENNAFKNGAGIPPRRASRRAFCGLGCWVWFSQGLFS